MVTDSKLIGNLSFSFQFSKIEFCKFAQNSIWTRCKRVAMCLSNGWRLSLICFKNAQPVYQVLLPNWPRCGVLQPFSTILLIRNMRHFVLKWTKYNVSHKNIIYIPNIYHIKYLFQNTHSNVKQFIKTNQKHTDQKVEFNKFQFIQQQTAYSFSCWLLTNSFFNQTKSIH